jgi:hypothetical protein
MLLAGRQSHPSHFRRNVDLMTHTVKTSLITGEDRIALACDAVNITLMSDTGWISIISDA